MRNTVIGAGGLLEDGAGYGHSFKQSFSLASKHAELQTRTKTADWLGADFEERVKQFNDKFMESLTATLTEGLGLELKQTKEEAENRRRANIGQSFVEKAPSNSLAMDTKSPKSPVMHAFGPQQPLGKHPRPARNTALSASVVVPGLKGTSADAKQAPPGKAPGGRDHAVADAPMSVIQDAETANEQDTVQDDNAGSDRADARQKEAARDAAINLGKSILSNEEQSELHRSIAKRASVLKEEEARRSAMNS